MNSLIKSLKNWFGYTRRERRSTFILLMIIVVVYALRYTIPVSRISLEDFSASMSVPESSESSPGYGSQQPADRRKQETESRDTRGWQTKPGYKVKKTDLNKCDSADLESLPGIGPVLSARIIKYRKLLGGYVSIDQLKEVYGLRDSTFRIVEGRITADPADVSMININQAGFRELDKHPYLERSDVQAIMKYRELTGRISGITELVKNKILSEETTERIRPYLLFE